ncbi:hypothetical protein V8E54_007000, partial [Elaphomyces granulatus]
ERGSKVVREPCPILNIGHNKTRSSAIHGLLYIGQLRPWANFEASDHLLAAACASVNWRHFGSILAHRPTNAGAAHLSHEHVVCGDETGVQGRFQANIDQVISAVFQATGRQVAFGDYTASQRVPGLDGNVPDVVCLTTGNGDLR